MDPTTAHELLSQVQVIDVRKAYEWEAGHVEGAVHITLQELPARVVELDVEIPVIVTCQIGQRSGIATKFLRERGYDAHNLDGGLERWVEEGFALVSAAEGVGAVVDGWAETLEW
jgi:rhodanese-related sulfurtransferase